MHVGVVRRGFLQIGTGQVAVKRISKPIDDRGVDLEPHVAGKACGDHLADVGTVLGASRFLLDDGRHDQGLVRGPVRQVGHTRSPGHPEFLAHFEMCPHQQVPILIAGDKSIGIRKEPTLAVRRSPWLVESEFSEQRIRRRGRQCVAQLGLRTQIRKHSRDARALHDSEAVGDDHTAGNAHDEPLWRIARPQGCIRQP